MHHGLFIAKKVVRQLGILFEGLADPGDIPMPENSQAAFEKSMSLSVALGVLPLEERDDRLCHGQAFGHEISLLVKRRHRQMSSAPGRQRKILTRR
jgi:hypothetical protein